jgi:hypothetical protein
MGTFKLAQSNHDKGCRDLTLANTMGESIQLLLCREPSFLEAENIGNDWSQVIVYVDDKERVIGMSSRSGRKVCSFGEVSEVGYLSQLRSYEGARNPRVLFRGYQFLKKLHDLDTEHPVPYYLTTIFSENTYARNLFSKKVRGMPRYSPITELSTFAIGAPRFLHSGIPEADVHWSDNLDDLYKTFERGNVWSSAFSLGSFYGPSDYEWLKLCDWRVVSVNGPNVEASALVVDMTRLRQVVIAKYSGMYQLLPMLSKPLQCLGFSKIPGVNENLDMTYVLSMSLGGDEELSLKTLISSIRKYEAFKNGLVVLGFDSRNPLQKSLSKASLFNTKSILYSVSWDADLADQIAARSSLVHLDSGIL